MKVNTIRLCEAISRLPAPTYLKEIRQIYVEDYLTKLNRGDPHFDASNAIMHLVTLTAAKYCDGSKCWYTWEINIKV